MTHLMGRSSAADTSLVEVRQAKGARFVGCGNYLISQPCKIFQQICVQEGAVERRPKMPIVFERYIYFEAADNTAVIWGDDEKGQRFRLTISRRALTDRYG